MKKDEVDFQKNVKKACYIIKYNFDPCNPNLVEKSDWLKILQLIYPKVKEDRFLLSSSRILLVLLIEVRLRFICVLRNEVKLKYPEQQKDIDKFLLSPQKIDNINSFCSITERREFLVALTLNFLELELESIKGKKAKNKR